MCKYNHIQDTFKKNNNFKYYVLYVKQTENGMNIKNNLICKCTILTKISILCEARFIFE